jgi:hypothetical protein
MGIGLLSYHFIQVIIVLVTRPIFMIDSVSLFNSPFSKKSRQISFFFLFFWGSVWLQVFTD